jgi:hypothetical protein
MKRLLVLVLLVIWLAVNAGARAENIVLIYSFTEKSTEYTCDINGITDMNEINWIKGIWDKSVKTSTGYFIVQWTSPISLNVWTVNTGKRNDVSPDGKMHKYAKAERPAEFSIAQAGIGKKTTWLVGSISDIEHTLLTGEEKPIRILGEKGDAATKLAGTRTWYYTDPNLIMHVGSSAISLRWQSNLTNEVLSDLDPLKLDGWLATDWLAEYLHNKGYIIIPTVL